MYSEIHTRIVKMFWLKHYSTIQFKIRYLLYKNFLNGVTLIAAFDVSSKLETSTCQVTILRQKKSISNYSHMKFNLIFVKTAQNLVSNDTTVFVQVDNQMNQPSRKLILCVTIWNDLLISKSILLKNRQSKKIMCCADVSSTK